jgi:hypothetical protein
MSSSQQKYPDLSSPISSKEEYPDLSSPVQDNNVDMSQPQDKKSFFDKLGDYNRKVSEDLGFKSKDIKAAYNLLTSHNMPLEQPAQTASLLTSFAVPEMGATRSGGIAKQIIDSMIKTGIGSHAGTKLMPGADDNAANIAAGVGAGTAGVLTPIGIATGSLNPFLRFGARTLAGGATGYGAGSLLGHENIGAGIGGLLGAKAGMRGAAPMQMAASEIAESLTPEVIARAAQREQAAQRLGLDVTAAETTGNPVLKQMQMQAANTPSGSQVLYPYGLNRQEQEKTLYDNFLNQVSPNHPSTAFDIPFSGQTLETAAYARASDIADKQRLRIDTRPIIERINYELQNHVKGGEVNKVLNKAMDRLEAVPSSRSVHLPPESVQYEHSLQGLHNAKMELDALINKKGSEAIDSAAKGRLKQIRTELNTMMREASPQYAAASDISNKRQARDQIEEAMSKSQITGANLYQKIIQDRGSYDDLYGRLGNPNAPHQVTPAQQSLRDMRDILPDLIDNTVNISSKQLAKQASDISGMDLSGIVKSFMTKSYFDKYNTAISELITNPHWRGELNNITNINSREDRGVKLARLIAKISATGSSQAYQNAQGSEQNGTRP